MQDTVAQVSRVVGAHTCDVLLLAGDGTRLPAMRRAVLAALPVAASRIIDLNATLNRSAIAALGPAALQAPATMMPAIAAALERRNSLASSGLGASALRQLGAPTADARRNGSDLLDTGSRALIAQNDGALSLRPAAGSAGSLPGIVSGLVPSRGA
jgi:hypothetical protein